MESTNFTPRTYTAQSCTLTVTTKALLPQLAQLDRHPMGDFTLQIERAEHGEVGSIVLNGQLEQLHKLHQSVSKYVSQLVAEFPGTGDNADRHLAEPVEIPSTTVVDRLYPESGIVKNLPGLRRTSQLNLVEAAPKTLKDKEDDSTGFSAMSVSKLLNRYNTEQGGESAPNRPTREFTPRNQGALPRLSSGDRPHEHKLYLSDNNSGRVLTLSQIQLLNLGTTLDEYANDSIWVTTAAPETVEAVKPSEIDIPAFNPRKNSTPASSAPAPQQPASSAPAPQQPAIVNPPTKELAIAPPPKATPSFSTPTFAPPQELPALASTNTDPAQSDEETKPASIVRVSGLSQLPNLPTNLANSPTETKTGRLYDYGGDDARSGVISALPWVAAAAMVVGIPLLLFGTNPDFVKESMAKVKLPKDPQHMFDGKPVASTAKPESATNPTGDGVANAATGALPKPWEAKPVEPPQVNASPGLPGTTVPQPGASDIGVAPLPSNIANATEAASSPQIAPPTASNAPVDAIASTQPQPSQIPSAVAPNPLAVGGIPNGVDRLGEQPLVPIPMPKATTGSKIAKSSTKPKITKPTTAVAAKPKATNPTNSLQPAIIQLDPVRKPAQAQIAARKPNIALSSPIPFPSNTAFPTADIEQPIPLSAPAKQPKKAVKSKPKRVTIAKKVITTPTAPRNPKRVVKVTAPTPSPEVPQSVGVPAETPSTQPRTAVGVPEQTPMPIPSIQPEFSNPTQIPPIKDLQAPPVVPAPQIQSKNTPDNDPFDSPSLKETKRYFQDKWRADATQSMALQYIVQVNGKSGVVESVNPQGEAATSYLNKTGMLKPGQKLVSPTTASENGQKIRVLLQPNGNVDTFVEP